MGAFSEARSAQYEKMLRDSERGQKAAASRRKNEADRMAKVNARADEIVAKVQELGFSLSTIKITDGGQLKTWGFEVYRPMRSRHTTVSFHTFFGSPQDNQKWAGRLAAALKKDGAYQVDERMPHRESVHVFLGLEDL